MNDDYKRGWYDGFMEALRKNKTTYHSLPSMYQKNVFDRCARCNICGIEFKIATNYVCNNINCPTKVTCTTGGTGGFVNGGGGGTTTFANTFIGYNVNSLADNNMSMLKPEIITTIKTG